jgi:hypothetical protein
MIKIFYIILPVFLITTSLYGQKCKNFKDEIDPFTTKKIIISSGFSLSGLNIMNSQPDISGQFVLENDSIYLRLNSSLIFSNGSMVVPTENSKDMVDIKTNDYIIFKFEGNDKVIKLIPTQASGSLEKVVLGNTYIQSTAKFKITKEELMHFISNKVERSRISKNNENNYFDYVLNSTAKKENVIFASKCFLIALEK